MSRPAAMTDHLPASKVVRILLVLLLIAGPHVARVPIWVSLLIIVIGVWRGVAAQRTWRMPQKWLRIVISVATFSAVWMQFGSLNGQLAGTTLLVAMLAVKLLEMTERRDYLVVIYLSYFVLVTHFLFSQEMAMAALMFAGALAITVVLIDINHPNGSLPLKSLGRMSGLLMLQALPLMVIFFILFPRIPGPLWGLPTDAGAGLTGLSDSMSPGDIGNLALSDEVAFRVRFSDKVPKRGEMYWRGPVFDFFDGQTWRAGAWNGIPRKLETEFLSEPIEYEIQLEAHGQKWLLALDLPTKPWLSGAKMGPDLVLTSRQKIIEKRLYLLKSATQYRADVDLPTLDNRRQRSLPNNNPKTRELALGWKAKTERPLEVVSLALQHFRNQAFVYTLRPPLMRKPDNIDQFLFEAQRGFCEHYASAFTFLMRAAGIPARVVTGYQGGERNGDYYIIRQSDAHAWSEVWIENQGWLRVDPTAAVAPERVELGIGGALGFGEPVPGLARLNRNILLNLQLQLDQVNALWNRWVLAYGPELQQSFLAALGLPGMRTMLLSLTILSVLVLIGVNWMLNRANRLAVEADPVFVLWQSYLRKLTRAGFTVRDSEGPLQLQARLQALAPPWLMQTETINKLYVRLRYASQTPDSLLLKALQREIRSFTPKRNSIAASQNLA